jgi:hypothetical protein
LVKGFAFCIRRWINHTGAQQLPLVKFQLPPREASNPFAVPRRLIIGPQTYSLTK